MLEQYTDLAMLKDFNALASQCRSILIWQCVYEVILLRNYVAVRLRTLYHIVTVMIPSFLIPEFTSVSVKEKVVHKTIFVSILLVFNMVYFRLFQRDRIEKFQIACLSIDPYLKTRERLNGFFMEFYTGKFTKIVRKIPIMVKTGQQ